MKKELPDQFKKQYRQTPLTRRALLKLGLAGGASLLAAACGIPNPATSETPPLKPELSDVEILDQEIQRLGIVQNQEEGIAWTNAFNKFKPEKPVQVTEEEAFKIGEEKVETVVSLMQKSQNPHFKNAGKLIEEVTQKIGRFSLLNDLSGKNNLPAFGVKLIPYEEKAIIEINISLDAVLNRIKDPTQLALLLTYIADHIKSMIDFQESLPKSITVQQRFEKERERLSTKDKLLFYQAIAFGKEAEAYIYQYGIGYKEEGNNKKNAAMFVRLGKDGTNQKWQDYVKKEMLNYPSFPLPPKSPIQL